MRKQLKFSWGTYEIGDGYSVTKFEDGTELHAHPNKSPEDLARAEALGYGDDVEWMTQEHDLFHHLLAEARGWWHSNVVWNTAHGEPVGPGGDDEERIVMLMARLANGGLAEIIREHESNIGPGTAGLRGREEIRGAEC